MIAPPKDSNLEKESLLASGLKDSDRFIENRGKLGQLAKQFIGQLKPSQGPVEKGRALSTGYETESQVGTNFRGISD